MGDKDKDLPAQTESDARIVWLESKLTSILKVKIEKVKKMTLADEHRSSALCCTYTPRRRIVDFFESHDCHALYIVLNNKDDLTADNSPPVSLGKKKSLYFLKTISSSVNDSNLKTAVVCGEMGAPPLEQLLTVAQEVYFPLLTNPKNQEGWPEVITKEITENLHKFLANLYVTIGHTKVPPPPLLPFHCLTGTRGKRYSPFLQQKALSS
jgi:dynein heavy chain, axonemal